VSITVTAVNDTPTAIGQSVSTDEDSSIDFDLTLNGADPEGDPLTFAIATQPSNGTASLNGSTFTYTPDSDFSGSDSFTFTVNDGTTTSTPATVTISVGAVNDRPVAIEQAVTTAEDTPIVVILTGTDADGDPLTYALASVPANGSVALNGSTVTYTPNSNFNGTDKLWFTVSDGLSESEPVAVSITVTPVVDVPLAIVQAVTTAEDVAIGIELTGTSIDGGSLTYAIADPPLNGGVTLSGNLATYTPNTDFNGSDRFTFTVTEGLAVSAVTTIDHRDLCR
jgi:VCBS repeat-containing protein